MQKQSFDQSTKNFWSFIENNNVGNNSELTKSMIQQQSFTNLNNGGFSQTNFSQSSANPNKITGLSYQAARTKAALK